MKRIIAEHFEGDDVPKEVAAGLCLYNELIDRNRRCLLAYLNYRMQRIAELRWEVGLGVPKEKMDKLHEQEVQYFHLYNEYLDTYMKHYLPSCKGPLDLTADCEAPEDVNVQIRVRAEDLGDLITSDSGVVRLRKGYQLFVKRTDIEHLIRAGKVEHVRTLRVEDVGGGMSEG